MRENFATIFDHTRPNATHNKYRFPISVWIYLYFVILSRSIFIMYNNKWQFYSQRRHKSMQKIVVSEICIKSLVFGNIDSQKKSTEHTQKQKSPKKWWSWCNTWIAVSVRFVVKWYSCCSFCGNRHTSDLCLSHHFNLIKWSVRFNGTWHLYQIDSWF